ncbi:hypothetical protein K8353_01315 [Burkholderia contaminans]|nr:hypothetical protein [Burkholderia contaminans]
MTRERYLVASAGGNVEGTRAGLVKFLQLLDRYDDAVIIVPKIADLKNNMLTQLLEENEPAIAKALIRDREYVFAGGKRVRLCAEAALKNFARSTLYLVLWGSHDTITEVEALHFWSAVVLVSWQSGDYKWWVQDHPVEVIYDDGVPDFKL